MLHNLVGLKHTEAFKQLKPVIHSQCKGDHASFLHEYNGLKPHLDGINITGEVGNKICMLLLSNLTQIYWSVMNMNIQQD